MPENLVELLSDQFFIPLYLLTWIISIIRYRRYFDTPLKYLPMIIIYTFFTELLGYFIKYNNEFLFFSDSRYAWHNVVIYNIYQVVFFLFFYLGYRKILHSKTSKKWIAYGIYICIASYFVNALFMNPLHNRLIYAHIIGSVILIIIIGLYFKESNSEKTPYPVIYNLMQWISVGLLIFYISFPVITILYKLNVNIKIRSYLRPALLTSIVLMYVSFIVGLVIGKRKAFR